CLSAISSANAKPINAANNPNIMNFLMFLPLFSVKQKHRFGNQAVGVFKNQSNDDPNEFRVTPVV
ncbi:MAG: hypothetical protein J6Y07_00470, partial [Alphaproteobacteria bacterium]|nr:hypothetical protein [Alphaproteobacteria bacterium]